MLHKIKVISDDGGRNQAAVDDDVGVDSVDWGVDSADDAVDVAVVVDDGGVDDADERRVGCGGDGKVRS